MERANWTRELTRPRKATAGLWRVSRHLLFLTALAMPTSGNGRGAHSAEGGSARLTGPNNSANPSPPTPLTQGERGVLSAPLTYRFKPGETYVYQVRIEGETPDGKQTLEGKSQYTVKSVDSATGQITLENSASLAMQTRQKAVGGFPFAPFPPRAPRGLMGPGGPFGAPSYGMTRKVTIDSHGGVIGYDGDSQLPFLLGNLWQLVIDPLPAEGEDAWEVHREVEIWRRDVSLPPLPPFLGSRQPRRSAKEEASYKLVESSGESAVIEKKYRLATVEEVTGEPALEQSGEGRITFDRSAEVTQSLDMKLAMVVRQENATVRIPVSVSARLLDAADAEKYVQEKEAARAQALAAAAEAGKPKTLDGAGIDAALADLRARETDLSRTERSTRGGEVGRPAPSVVDEVGRPGPNASLGDKFRVQEALRRLAGAIVVEQRRAEVAEAVEALLDDGDHFVRVGAAKALAVWGTDESVPKLIAALEDRDVFLRMAAIKALGRFKDRRAAEAVARQLTEQQGRMEASQALQTMGPLAEEPVLAMLGDREWTVRLEACKILGAVGTVKSIEPLKGLLARSKGLVAMEAEKAIDAIESRGE